MGREIRTSVDLKGGGVEETAVEEGLETGLVERMGGLVDGFGHVGVVEPNEGLGQVSKSDSHHIESESLDYYLAKSYNWKIFNYLQGYVTHGGAPGPPDKNKTETP